ncbi:MAG: ABC transporter permease [Alkaliphilus sp.]|nr:sugar ABC transporter permease [Alkaliphilus sp. AH-315-G20]MBN4069823.1 sugar ABC transporter permease [bacterium AH-315-G05]PHS31352.1 MAG: ABC transporter permease [Alkaliphilus sp.]
MGNLKERWGKWGEKLAPFVLLSPFLFGFIVFFLFAFFRTLYFSFTRYDLFTAPVWIGLGNYVDLFSEHLFTRALKNSLTYALIVTPLQTIFAMLLAVTMNQKMRGIKYIRAAYYMPSVTSSVVITLIFVWLFQRKGLINYLLTMLRQYSGLISIFLILMLVSQLLLIVKEKWKNRPVSYFEPSYIVLSIAFASIVTYLLKDFGIITIAEVEAVNTIWLNTRETVPGWAGWLSFPRPLGAIMMINIWTTAPTFMLLYLAGLQDIPKEIYEAAEIDGAKGWHKFWYITVPQLSHITFLVVIMGLIGTLQMFDQVAIIGFQAPLESTVTLAYYVYHSAFPTTAIPAAGMASAAAIILAVFTLAIVFVQRIFMRERRD